ncbi:MAG: DNA translocase FtsK 4TM domain-containing protein, partial [Clostridia bacterium]|nr:DNA translocase FtsK 4TM domain-containing protein [Clostridia bacterium]
MMKNESKEPKQEKREQVSASANDKPVSFPKEKMIHQAMPVILFGLAVFLGICIYSEASTGVVGNFFHTRFFGITGCAAYFVPPFLLIGTIFWRRDAERKRLLPKTLFLVLELLLFSVLFYTYGMPDMESTGTKEWFDFGLQKVGGGVVGGTLGSLLLYAVNKTGTVIICAVCMVLFLVFFFGFNPYSFVRRFFSVLFSDGRKARREKRRENVRRREQQAKAIEAEKEGIHRKAVGAFYGKTECEPLPSLKKQSSRIPEKKSASP